MPTYPNLNFQGSSGFGINRNGGYGPLTATPDSSKTPGVDYGVFDIATGKVVSLNTGKPWTGPEPRTGQTFNNGTPSAGGAAGAAGAPGWPGNINPNDPNQRYKPVDIVKAPDIAAAGQDLLKTFKDSAAASLKDFNDYVSTFKSSNQAASQAGQAAVAQIPRTQAALQGEQNQYNQSLNQASSDYANLNRQAAGQEQGIVDAAQQNLGQYDAAKERERQLALETAAGAVSRYGAGANAGAGANLGLGSDITRLALQEATKASVPIDLAKIGAQQNLYQNLSLPVSRDIYGREQNRVSQFNPAVAAQEFQSGQVTTNTLQQLSQLASTMSYDNAMRLFASIGVPAEIQQKILSGQISQLGAIGQIEDQSHYRGLADVSGFNLPQPQFFNTAQPAYPNYGTSSRSRYAAPSLGGTGSSPLGGNAPVTVGATNPSVMDQANPNRYMQDPNTGGFWDMASGQWYAPGQAIGGSAPDYRVAQMPTNESTGTSPESTVNYYDYMSNPANQG